MLRTIYLRLASPEGFPSHVPAWELDSVVLLWIVGWLLQLHWLRLMVKKAYRKFVVTPTTTGPRGRASQTPPDFGGEAKQA